MLCLEEIIIKEENKVSEVTHAPFSVLMSVYVNENEEYFRQCMESILQQTICPNEILIIKDGPVKPGIDQAIEEYSKENLGLIKVIAFETNHGLGFALNKGVEAAANELIARMDTDDVSRRDRFEKQLYEFERNPQLDICGSQIDEFENNVENIVARRHVPTTDAAIKKYQKRRDGLNHVSVMFKRSVVLRAGNYQSCPLMEDTYLWVRMFMAGATCMNIDEALVYVRIGQGMYERRGGWKYFKLYKEGRKKVYQTGYIGKKDYYVTLIVQLIVALLPAKIRGSIFKKVLHR